MDNTAAVLQAISAADWRRSDGLWTAENTMRVIGRLDLAEPLVVCAVVSRPPVREIEVWEVRIDPSGSVLMHALPGAVCPGTSGASGGVWCIWRDCGRVLKSGTVPAGGQKPSLEAVPGCSYRPLA